MACGVRRGSWICGRWMRWWRLSLACPGSVGNCSVLRVVTTSGWTSITSANPPRRVAEAARACFGEGPAQSAAWRHKVVHLALEQDVDAVLDEVTQQRTTLRSPAKRAALARLRNYVGERTSMIRYAENRARGWDIGSGPTESLCKTMARRLKGAGMRWDPAGADAILQLTALQDSNAWENYWKLTAQQN